MITTIYSMPDLTIDDVIKAYSGKNNKCLCGCAGKYSYTKDAAKSAKIIMGKIAKNASNGISIQPDGDSLIIYTAKGDRIYLLYTK